MSLIKLAMLVAPMLGVSAHDVTQAFTDTPRPRPAITRNVQDTGHFGNCRDQFANGEPPAIASPDPRARALCFNGFAVLHSGKTKNPVYSAEVLSRQRILDARNLQRTDAFYEEARIPSRDRAALNDFRGSTYARGHLSAAADMANAEAMAQSFSLANIIPQNQVNNAKAWVTIEKATRQYALRAKGNVYVITGPAYLRNHCPFVKEAKDALARAGIAAPTNPQAVVAAASHLPGTRVPYRYDAVACTIGSGVAVPTHIFKLVYDASTNRAWAHWSENTSQTRVYPPISYAELVELTGIEYLPGIKPQP
ncbi:DNA/RNA non-specific endonuclease [Polaromonas sp. AET17H-212]|uniref:DNA/RNA non-specific endonuclease n=1 Tax=Polaromonas sp. AET17H-212 TaxID=1977061 RepID=UPI001141B024|nr:DNA/RNA non-specific endonuclease [Polaromonas sp. AET17H-212]